MNKTKLGLLATTLSALLLSMGAFASDLGTSATGPGPGGGEPGTPVYPAPGAGGGSCYFAYHIRKVAVDFDRNHDHDDEIRFKIFVTNIGSCDLRRINVTDFLPERTEFVRAEPEPDFRHDDKLVWKDVRLFPGERAVFEISVKVKDHDRDHHHDHDFRITNTGCAFTPWIGIRICDSAFAWADHDDHHDHHPGGLN